MSEKRFTYGETIDYNFFDVFEEKKYLGMIQRDSTKIVDRLNEQQATIRRLQDLCGESDSENARLRIENKKLQEEIKLLKPTNVEQYEQIVQLQEENEQLRQMIKENVFQRCAEGSLADLEFKAIAYDDIVRVEMSNESELKVIVSCRQGKKENVKSFCQMFIPFGVYYEIKEIND